MGKLDEKVYSVVLDYRKEKQMWVGSFAVDPIIVYRFEYANETLLCRHSFFDVKIHNEIHRKISVLSNYLAFIDSLKTIEHFEVTPYKYVCDTFEKISFSINDYPTVFHLLFRAEKIFAFYGDTNLFFDTSQLSLTDIIGADKTEIIRRKLLYHPIILARRIVPFPKKLK